MPSPLFLAIRASTANDARHSCGGLQALEASYDRRVTTVLVLNSGLFDDGDPYMQRFSVDRSMLPGLRVPTGYFIGGEGDVAYANAMKDWPLLEVASVMANLDVGHGATYQMPGGGPLRRRRSLGCAGNYRGIWKPPPCSGVQIAAYATIRNGSWKNAPLTRLPSACARDARRTIGARPAVRRHSPVLDSIEATGWTISLQRGFQGELILYGDWTKFATTEAMQSSRIANISSSPQDWGSLKMLRTSLPSVSLNLSSTPL